MTGEFGWFGVGKAQQLEKGHLFWVGEFSGTFFNDKGQGSLFHHAGVRCPGSNDVDSNKKKNKKAPPAAADSAPKLCANAWDFIAANCQLTWQGISVLGAGWTISVLLRSPSGSGDQER